MPGKGGENTESPTDSSSMSAARSMQSPSRSFQRSPALSISRLHDLLEHLHRLAFLASHVLEDGLLAVRRDDHDPDRMLLPKAPATADGLVVLLVRVREADKEHVGAVLPVESPAGDRGLGDDHPRAALGEGDEALFLHVGMIRAPHF